MAICLAHYEDLHIQDEQEAPMLSLGERVIWTSSDTSWLGSIRWIGRVPQLYSGWTVGVEFDKLVPNGGDGHFNRKRYFLSENGHGLFLPVSDLITESNYNQRTNGFSHPKADCDPYLNRFQHFSRDSTYGHFRHSCCSRRDYYDYDCDLHHCNHSPIYGRISTRQAFSHRDSSHENCNNCFSSQQHDGAPLHRHYSPLRYPTNQSTYQRQNSCKEIHCPDDSQSEISLFNPRSTIKLINGLKQWVTCWILGTTKHKSKKQIVLNERSTLTSLIVTNSQRSKTGQRLSQFGDYSSVNQFTPLSNPTLGHLKVTENNFPRHRYKQKKRPAPLPPSSNATDNSANRSLNEVSKEMVNHKSLLPKKSPKKRRAPLPPVSIVAQQALDFHTTFLQQAKQAGVYNGEKQNSYFLNNFPSTSLQIQAGSMADDKNDEDWEIIPKFDADHPEFINNAEIDETVLGIPRGDVNFSRDQKSLVNKELLTNLPHEKQLYDKSNDLHFKISIERREMNFVTVEELPDDQSIASDSDEDDNFPQLQQLALDDPKSSSSGETSPGDSNPIFDEFQIAPSGKASVKDFVNAFNLLADRGRNNSNIKSHSNLTEESKTETKSANDKDSLSIPTKWQFQKNCLNSFPRNRLLVPIQEESHNDSSEPEIHESVNHAKSHKTKAQEAKKSFSAIFKEWEANNTHGAVARKDTGKVASASLASSAAISSLLKPDCISANKGAKAKNFFGSKSVKAPSKQEQPIVVSLYIEDKSSHRGPIPLIVVPSMSLRKLKKKIEKEYNFDKDLQCWILGETFAIHDEASLASYGVVDSGCPVLLYVMAVESKEKSLPKARKLKSPKVPIYDDVAISSSDSDTEDVTKVLDREIGRSWKRSKLLASNDRVVDVKKKSLLHKQESKTPKQSKPDSVVSQCNNNNTAKKDYHALVELDDIDLVSNTEAFECPVCFLDVEPSYGAVLQECLHSFCKECLAGAVEFSETAVIKCPFRNNEYSCESHLQEREVKSLVSPEIFERHLQRSMALAESQAQDSFHCKTPDCPGWCLYEDNVNTFRCPVCHHLNCLTCNAIHEGKNCRQYQDHVATYCDSNEEAKKTKEYLEKMVEDGEAMKCPKCEVILMKKWGCDWLKCSMCHTEVCWVTKGPRWGPAGRGDTSGGCKCMLNGIRCHPKCSYCH